MTIKNSILIIFILFSIQSKAKMNSKKATYEINVAFLSITKKDSLSTLKKYETAKELFLSEKYSESLEASLKILDEAKLKNQDYFKFLISQLIGEIYDKTNQHKKAIIYYNDSANLLMKYNFFETTNSFEKENKINSLSKLYLRLSGCYLKEYKTITQKKNTNKLNNIKEKIVAKKYKDSALLYSKMLDDIEDLNNEVRKNKGISYINLSALYHIDSLYDKSEYYAKKAIDIHKFRKDKKRIASSLNNLGSVYISDKKYSKAKKTYLEALNIINEDSSFEAIKFKITLYSNLAWAMRNMGEVEAYDNLETSYVLNDNLNEKELKEIIKKIETESNENITKLEHEKDIKIATIKKQSTTYLLLGISILILTISTIVIYNYKLRQRNLQLMLTKNKLIEEQNLDRLRSESQAKILNATIDGKESERKNIAETLHDSVSALLSSANMHITATKKQFNGNIPNELEKTQLIILEASKTVRDLSHNLVSSILLKFGLEYATKDIAKKYSNSELKFHTDITNIGRYDQDIEIKIYNIIQELVNNIIKHSAANNAHIVLKEANNRIFLLVEDDGIGFNYKQNKIKSGIGLNQLEARIEVMKGNFTIESSNNKGTKISISIPAPKRFKFDFAHLTQ